MKLFSGVDDNQILLFSVLNCCRLLTRLLPYIFEDPDWYGYFWSTVKARSDDDPNSVALAQLLLGAICVREKSLLIRVLLINFL